MSQFETSENLTRYFKDVDAVSTLLSREDELSLAVRISNGDENAVNELVQANLKFVVKLANGFIGLGTSIDDLINAGNLGLISAAQRFDPIRAKSNKFITYAQSWIRKMIHLEIDNARVVKLPLNKEYELYMKKKAGEITTLGKSVSIDKSVGGEDDSPTIGDSMATVETDNVSIRHNKWVVNQLTKNLTDHQKTIISLAYGLNDQDPMTVKEIAAHLKVDIKEVSATLRHAKKQMRARAERVATTRTFQHSI